VVFEESRLGTSDEVDKSREKSCLIKASEEA
jgi:hypothetical protein